MNKLLALATPLALATITSAFAAGPNLVTNGSFEQSALGQVDGIVTVPGWKSIGTPTDGAPFAFNFILDTTADDAQSGLVGGFPSVNSAKANSNIFIWGPGNGRNNGFTGSSDGGKFMGLDGGYAISPISQTINGLTVGHQYELSFEWAGSQFTGETGATIQRLDATFGGTTQSTTTRNVASQGFVPWQKESFTFVASATSQALSFLAVASPAVPPFVLLDGVSLLDVSAVPEAQTWALMLCGMLGLGLVSRRRARQGSGI